MKVSKRLYQSAEWKELRTRIVEHAGNKCEKCARAINDGAVLQVHHIKYHRGRRPWEYAAEELTVLCRRCHAEEHNILMEHCNWAYEYENVRDEKDGICDFCGNDIKYEHNLSHQRWGNLTVGTGCSDFLTETKSASHAKKKMQRFTTFCARDKWVSTNRQTTTFQRHKLKVDLVEIANGKFKLIVNGTNGKECYLTKREAQRRVFDLFESGKLDKYIPKNRSR